MVARAREAEACPWREPGGARGPSGCRLVALLAEEEMGGGCPVGDEVCAACCRSPAPTERSPNGVVASLAHGILSRGLRDASSPRECVRISERIRWVEPFLDGGRTDERPRGGRLWRRSPRIGLIGRDDLKGLGHLNRDLMRWLPLDRWLVLGPRDGPADAAGHRDPRIRHFDAHEDSLAQADRWLRGLDVVLFVESPLIEGVTKLARRRGIRIVCVPQWEWLHPGLDWLRDVDLMLCPTAYTRRLLEGWRARFHFGWDVRLCPWPVDVERFDFRARTVCRRYLMINGRPASRRRKGLDLLLEAARRLPSIPFVIRSQAEDLPPMPSNVELRPAAANNRELYEEGDVCVQLSRWEGLGLPLLECQAAGLPLITTDAAPMNEHHPMAVVPVADDDLAELWHGRLAALPRMRVDDVVDVLAAWHGRDIARASLAARAYVERDHSWPRARPVLLDWLEGLR